MEEPEIASTTNVAVTARRGRPRLMLTDEQAACLARQTADLITKHAANVGRNQEFVLDFARAVYQVTGQTFSASIYRKLLRTYVPERAPSTVTIEMQRRALLREIVEHCARFPLISDTSSVHAEAELAQSDLPPALQLVSANYPAMLELVGLLHTLSGEVAKLAAPTQDESIYGLRIFNQYLIDQLAKIEAELADTRDQATRSFAKAQQAGALAAERAEQLAATQLAVAMDSAAILKLTEEMESLRLRTSRALDQERSKLQSLRERKAYFDGLCRERERELRAFVRIMISEQNNRS